MKRKRKQNKVYLIWFMAIILLVPLTPIMKFFTFEIVPMIAEKAVEKIGIVSLIIDNPKGYGKILANKYELEDKEYRLNDVSSGENSSEMPYSQAEIANQSSDTNQAVSKPEMIKGNKTENTPDDESEALPSAKSLSNKKKPPFIEKKYRGTIVEERYGGSNNPAFVKIGNGFLRNYTDMSAEKIAEIAKKKPKIKFEKTDEPQVLIIHTHATEAFEEYDCTYYDTRGTWRTTDNNKNMVAVGDVLEIELESQGINVIHDYTQHDYPSYNGSYSRSAKTVKEYLKKYPSIKVVFDLHRDAVEREDCVIVKSVADVGGKKAAQVMVVSGCDEDGSLNMPNWKENFRLAVDITNKLESDNKGITRPIFFCNAKYNMDLSEGLLILEFGTHANTLDEAKETARCVGKSLGELFKNYME
ncbi:MAG: stage II sporulation protein P [Oscillospiraceae bacterium]